MTSLSHACPSPGTELYIGGRTIRVVDHIPPATNWHCNHKSTGEMLHRYGQRIGRATREIKLASTSTRTISRSMNWKTQYEFPEHDIAIPAYPENGPKFLGYQRADGRAGTRNYIAVVAASNCAAHTVGANRQEL